MFVKTFRNSLFHSLIVLSLIYLNSCQVSPSSGVEMSDDPKELAGTYAGKFPCADCPAIDASLELKSDFSYFLEQKYKDRKTVFRELGSWNLPNDSTLELNGKDTSKIRFRLKKYNTLRMLDGDGHELPANLNGTLHKVKGIGKQAS